MFSLFSEFLECVPNFPSSKYNSMALPFNPAFLRKLHALRFKEFVSECLKLPRSDRVSLAYEFLQPEGLLPNIQPYSTKCSVKALEYKNSGNEAFFRKQDIEAVKLYTRSAAVALPGSVELGYAYANRSAALYRLKRFEACVVDINRALNENYPNASKSKLLDRKEKCQSELRKQHILKAHHRENDSLQTNQNYAMKESLLLDFTATDSNCEKFRPPGHNFKNGILSEKLKIAFDETLGYYYVAAKNIQPGELLGVEKPYASLLLSKHQYSHCSNCFVRCETLIPCVTCSSVMYCSENCRQNAFNQYHRIECKILSHVEYFQIMENGWLAFRMLMISTKQGEELEKLMNDPVFNRSEERTFDSAFTSHNLRDYMNIHGVEESFKKKCFKNLQFSYLTAAIFVHYLKNVEYFGEPTKTDHEENMRLKLTDKELFAGHLLAKFYLTPLGNVFGIREAINDELLPSIGYAIYPYHNLFNHSCDENVSVNFYKDVAVSHSIQMIRAGEQVCVSYGPTCRVSTRAVRQQRLRENFFFTCNCEACKFHWPLPEESLSLEDMSLHAVSKQMVQLYKNTAELPDLSREVLNPNNAKLFHNPKYFNFMRECSLLIPKSGKKPSTEYHECKEQFHKMFAMKANFYDDTLDEVLISL